MARKIGFGGRRDETPTTRQATSAPAPRKLSRTLMPLLIMSLMAGIGLYLAIDSLASGRIMGFVFGTIWTVVLITVIGGRVIRRALGIGRRDVTPHRGHDWHDDGR